MESEGVTEGWVISETDTGEPRCLVPFIAMNVYPTGGVRQCVSGSRDLGNLREGDSLAAIWTSPNYQRLRKDICSPEWPEVCRVCREREVAGLQSRRQILARDSNVCNESSLNSFSDLNVRFLDLAFSNRCNMWCRTCNSDFSSTWEKFETQLSPELRNSEFGVNLEKGIKKTFGLEQVLDILPYCKELRRLTIKGGEPFVEPMVLRFLEELLARDLTKNLTVTFVTNASIVSDEILGLLRRFQEVWLSYSIDGSDPVHRYIRGDQFHLERLAANIRRFRELPNLNERAVLPTISVYNVLDLPNLYRWCQEELQTRPTFYQVLVSPEILNLKVLPPQFRNRVIESLIRFKTAIETEDPRNAQHLQRMMEMLKPQTTYRDMEESQERYFRQFVQYTKEVDRLRGQNVLQVIPEFQELEVF